MSSRSTLLGYRIACVSGKHPTGDMSVFPFALDRRRQLVPDLTLAFERPPRGGGQAFVRGRRVALNLHTRLLYVDPHANHGTLLMRRESCLRTVLCALGALWEAGHFSAASGSRRLRPVLALHASAVESAAGALVFVGPSGAGKSTISAGLLHQYPLLEDDIVFLYGLGGIRSRDCGAWLVSPRRMAGAPPGLDGRRCGWMLPLASMFLLRKSRQFRLEAASAAHAAAALLPQVLTAAGRGSLRRRLRLLSELLEHPPCRVLHFRKESRPLVRMLRRAGLPPPV